ncbi:MAG: stage II sporulation protein D [Clostridia bacterium]|nr:stage II sporulation protein D [Clostridia bacterium]
MKKIIFYFCFVIILIFVMPMIFTNKFKTEEVLSSNMRNQEKFDYGDYSKIKLLHTENGSIEELDLDTYLYGVVASEMPANFEMEALKAQAVVARTYTIYQIRNGNKHENASICDSASCCQAWISKENRFARWDENFRIEYWKKIISSVDETKGKIIFYNNEPINALFHSNSGGKTELAINVWGGNFPYFQTVETNGEDAYTSYNSEIEISKDELITIMLENYPEFEINFDKENCIEIIELTEGDRVEKIRIGNIEVSGVEARKKLGLKSAKFDFEIIGNNVKFKVIGYGHGVGMSQCGSDALAKKGMKFDEIIKYYYKNVVISE